MLRKKLYLYCVAFAAALVLSACGGNGPTDPTDPGGGPVPDPLPPVITVSPESGTEFTAFTIKGCCFTPGGRVAIHRLSPDGADLTSDVGLAPGSSSLAYTYKGFNVLGEYHLWVVDQKTTTVSNTVKFTITAPAS